MSANAQYRLIAVEQIDLVNIEKKKGGVESLKERACGLPESETGINNESLGAGTQKEGSKLIKKRASDGNSLTMGPYDPSVNRDDGMKGTLGDKKDEGCTAVQDGELAKF